MLKKNTELSSLQLANPNGQSPIYNFDWKGMVFPWGPHQLKPDFNLTIQPKWDFTQVCPINQNH